MDLLNWLRPAVYISVHPEELRMRHVQSGRCITERPVVARNTKGKFIAAGKEAELLAKQSESTTLCNPFRHPRMVISDFEQAEYLFKTVARRLFRYQLLLSAPRALLHLRVDPVGGFTQIEVRAIAELALAIGVKHAIVWHGQVPADDELLNLQFRSGGRLLEY
jgi:rod shape-determining protein MreB and related proteins